MPVQDPLALQDPRVASLVQYAINVEKSMFENATSRVSGCVMCVGGGACVMVLGHYLQEEYYQLLAERIYRIRKELDERKRLKRIQGLFSWCVLSRGGSAEVCCCSVRHWDSYRQYCHPEWWPRTRAAAWQHPPTGYSLTPGDSLRT